MKPDCNIGTIPPLTLEEIKAARDQLGDLVVTTPVHEWEGPLHDELLGKATRVFMKLELFQRTGTFKARGALLNMLSLSPERRARGVTAISAGNHAVAVAYAANSLGVNAKVIMIKTANPLRVELCKRYGAEVEMAEDAKTGFERVKQVEKDEGRAFIHPFDGKRTALGTSTVGLELCRQTEELDAVIVPIGGGGLCAGISSAVKLSWPQCDVYGVEPTGADTMYRSFKAESPQAIDKIATIADSLGAPYATQMTYEFCRRNLQDVVLVSDDDMRAAMRLMMREAKLAVEPAGATAMAGLIGPLREKLRGKRVGLIVCGTNIDADSYARLLAPY